MYNTCIYKREKKIPIISEGQTIKHIPSIPARAVHGRHPCSLLTAGILQHRIEHDLYTTVEYRTISIIWKRGITFERQSSQFKHRLK